MTREEWLILLEQMHTVHLFCRLSMKRDRRSRLSSPEELEMLSRVGMEKRGITPLTLSQKMGLQKSLVSRLIEDMYQKGFLKKEKDSNDKRSYFLTLTSKGRIEMEQAYQNYLGPICNLYDNMNKDEVKELIHLMAKANKIFQFKENREELDEVL